MSVTSISPTGSAPYTSTASSAEHSSNGFGGPSLASARTCSTVGFKVDSARATTASFFSPTQSEAPALRSQCHVGGTSKTVDLVVLMGIVGHDHPRGSVDSLAGHPLRLRGSRNQTTHDRTGNAKALSQSICLSSRHAATTVGDQPLRSRLSQPHSSLRSRKI